MAYTAIDRRGGICILRFNCPEVMNALSTNAIEETLNTVTELKKEIIFGDFSLRVLIITGSGKAFIAGADVKEMSSMNSEEGAQFCLKGNELLRAIETFPAPVIAAVNGYALGGGLEMALSADFIYAADIAKFGLPEVTLGIIPGFGGIRRLALRVGTANARELIFSGKIIEATEACRLGIVNKVIDSEKLMEKTITSAQQIMKAAPGAIRAAKRHIEDCKNTHYEISASLEAERFGRLFAGKEALEGMNAFLEKRKPIWLEK